MTNRRELADRLEGGASGAFHPQMVSDLREAARLLREPVAGEVEAVARTICAHEVGGFCQNIGGDLGCKVGRGFAPDGDLCVATSVQLELSGRAATARAILRARLDDEGKGGEA